ncbi:MAG: sporulation transcription factor Spo0A [Clostridia bacterium]|nr:sporulation transcription factor Spo0A [Clostridia bacterium]
MCDELYNKLVSENYVNVDTVTSYDALKRALEKSFYNVVIADCMLVGCEDITYLRDNNPNSGTQPYTSEVILLSEKAVDDSVSDIGGKAVYTLKKPFDFAFLNRIIISQLENQRFKAANARLFGRDAIIERSVTSVMHGLGIPAHIKGYQFLRTAITKTINDPEMINYVTKSLYPTVARIHGTTPSRVERAIRHAIEVAWDRGDVDTLTSYFGYTISRQRGKPTNSEFIAMIADNLRMKNSDILDMDRSDNSERRELASRS